MNVKVYITFLFKQFKIKDKRTIIKEAGSRSEKEYSEHSVIELLKALHILTIQ